MGAEFNDLEWLENAKIGGFMDFFGDSGLRHKSISFTRWRHTTRYAMADVYIYMAVNKMSNLIDFKHLQTVLRAKAAMLSARFSHRNSVCLYVTRVDQSKAVQARITKSLPSAAWKTLISRTVKLFYKFEGSRPERGR